MFNWVSWVELSLVELCRYKHPFRQQLWSDAKVNQEGVLICAHILYLNLEYLPMGGVRRGRECGNKISNPASWYYSIVIMGLSRKPKFLGSGGSMVANSRIAIASSYPRDVPILAMLQVILIPRCNSRRYESWFSLGSHDTHTPQELNCTRGLLRFPGPLIVTGRKTTHFSSERFGTDVDEGPSPSIPPSRCGGYE